MSMESSRSLAVTRSPLNASLGATLHSDCSTCEFRNLYLPCSLHVSAMAITCTSPETCCLNSVRGVSSSHPVRFAAVIVVSAWMASLHSPSDSAESNGTTTSSTIFARRRVVRTREQRERPCSADTLHSFASPVQLAARATALRACMALSTSATIRQTSLPCDTMVLRTRAASSFVSIFARWTSWASASMAPGVRASASAASLFETRLRRALAATEEGLSCAEEARLTMEDSTPGNLLTKTLLGSAFAMRLARALAAAVLPSSFPLHTTWPSTSRAPERPTTASSSEEVLLVSATISAAACAASC
mmetsp:Transcript_12751/g.25357  ORF Transcript_12751/g.25357 Transcript_12751/m.25357 type:complete len:305 (+) Transcript_12751:895-1809(+)